MTINPKYPVLSNYEIQILVDNASCSPELAQAPYPTQTYLQSLLPHLLPYARAGITIRGIPKEDVWRNIRTTAEVDNAIASLTPVPRVIPTLRDIYPVRTAKNPYPPPPVPECVSINTFMGRTIGRIREEAVRDGKKVMLLILLEKAPTAPRRIAQELGAAVVKLGNGFLSQIVQVGDNQGCRGFMIKALFRKTTTLMDAVLPRWPVRDSYGVRWWANTVVDRAKFPEGRKPELVPDVMEATFLGYTDRAAEGDAEFTNMNQMKSILEKREEELRKQFPKDFRKARDEAIGNRNFLVKELGKRLGGEKAVRRHFKLEEPMLKEDMTVLADTVCNTVEENYWMAHMITDKHKMYDEMEKPLKEKVAGALKSIGRSYATPAPLKRQKLHEDLLAIFREEEERQAENAVKVPLLMTDADRLVENDINAIIEQDKQIDEALLARLAIHQRALDARASRDTQLEAATTTGTAFFEALAATEIGSDGTIYEEDFPAVVAIEREAVYLDGLASGAKENFEQNILPMYELEQKEKNEAEQEVGSQPATMTTQDVPGGVAMVKDAPDESHKGGNE